MNIKVISGITSGHLIGSDIRDPHDDDSFNIHMVHGDKYMVESFRYILMKLNRASMMVSRKSGYRRLNKRNE